MKKNYTLKITLAMLFVVLVSLVSFVGVYKGKNLVKDYSLGRDFEDKKVAVFSVNSIEQNNTTNETTTDESTETTNETATDESAETTDETATDESTETTNETATDESTEATDETTTDETAETTEETSTEGATETTDEASNEETTSDETDPKAEYKKAKNIIERRLANIKSLEYDIRLNEETGELVIEVPTDMDTTNLVQLVAQGDIQVKNTSTNEVLVESNGFKSASAQKDTTTYSYPIVTLKIEFTNDAKNILKNANTKYTNSEGTEDDATFAITLDGTTIYSDTASTFVSTAKNGSLDLVLGQGAESNEIDTYYESAEILVALIKNGKTSVVYQADSVDIVSSNINIKTIIIIASIVGAIMLIYAIFKYKKDAILPVISLIGLLASILLVLRYTNVQFTLFTILGIAIIIVANYVLILKLLKDRDKTFKENFIEILNMLIPCMIIAIVFCCAPYLQLATLGMSIFWGVIVMLIYDWIITRILIEK